MKTLLLLAVIVTTFSRAVAGPIGASAPVQPSASAAGNSLTPLFSADGQHLVFVSHANNLATNDDSRPWLDVFVRDLASSNTVLVSVSSNGIGGANADANSPSVSSNGQFVAFASAASNLIPGDNNNASDVFLRDMSSGVTRLVSVAVNGSSPVDPEPTRNVPLSGVPLVSSDGRWVVFESRATNLTASGAPPGSVNIYARDTWSNVTALVSANTAGQALGGISTLAGIDANARYVAFLTTNRTVVAGVTNSGPDVYVRDLPTGGTIWASSNAGALLGAHYRSSFPVLAANGSGVAYEVTAVNSGATFPMFCDLQTQISQRIFSFAISNTPPVISADGSAVAFEGSSNAWTQILLWERSSNAVRVAHEKQLGNFLDRFTHVDALSADGRFMVFREWGVDAPFFSNSLVQAYHLFRKDLTSGALELLTYNTNTTWSAGSFQFSAVSTSADLQRVAFDSVAIDLAAADFNGASDIFLRDLGTATTELISEAVPQRPAKTSQAYSFLGLNSISANGRFVISLRYDDPSAFRDTNGWTDVFVSDLWSNTTVAVSVNANVYFTNSGGGTVGGEGMLIENTNAYERPIISGDGTTIYAGRRPLSGGRFLVTTASSSNGGFSQAGLVSAIRAPAGGSGTGNSYAPSTSRDGQLLVFTTTATDLVEGGNDNNPFPDVVLRERVLLTNNLYASSNHLISVTPGGVTGNGVSSNGIISADGRWVVFESTASDLTTNATAGLLSLFARDWQSNVTYLVSVSPTGNPQWGYVPGSAVVSGNSRYVAFASGNNSLTVHDLLTHTSVIADNPLAASPSLDHHGRFVAYGRRSDISSFHQIYVRDLQTTEISLVSAGVSGGPGNGPSTNALISSDGRYVVFQSTASNLVANDANGVSDVFVRDRLLGVTMPLSANATGLSGNGPSARPIMAADGRTIVFQSFASDLISGDYNEKRDLFVVKLGGTDSDGDGMDDDWEVAHFGNLSREADDDFDGDGASERVEFLAGTDPKNDGSVFRVITVAPAGGGSRQLIWSGNPARSYRVEFKDDLNAAGWTAVNGTISWNGAVASITDTTAGGIPHRYYRAVRLP